MGKRTTEDLEVAERIRAHLRREMHERRIGQAEAVRRLGVDDGNFSRILSGTRAPGIGLALKICRVFNLNGTRLLEEDPPKKYFEVGSEKY